MPDFCVSIFEVSILQVSEALLQFSGGLLTRLLLLAGPECAGEHNLALGNTTSSVFLHLAMTLPFSRVVCQPVVPTWDLIQPMADGGGLGAIVVDQVHLQDRDRDDLDTLRLKSPLTNFKGPSIDEQFLYP